MIVAAHSDAKIQQKLAAYKPGKEAIALIQKTQILLLVGISGAGKGAITSELLTTGEYHYIVSHTTRQPRVNNGVLEQDGREYHFITLDQAERMLDEGKYVEAKLYNNNIYGTSVAEFEAAYKSHQIATTDIEVQGAAEYIAINPQAKVVFILPPSYETWHQRLFSRHDGAMGASEQIGRMQTALYELEHALATPYFYFVVNDNLSAAVQEIDRIAHGDESLQEAAEARNTARSLCDRLHAEYLQEVEERK